MAEIDEKHEHKPYLITIDKQTYEVDSSTITGRAVLELAGKTPVEQFALYLKVAGGQPIRIALDEVIDLRSPGKEKFLTLPLDQTEGRDSRRQFVLPVEDMQWLESTGLEYELAAVDGTQRVHIHGFHVPAGYTTTSATVSVRIETGYPDAQIDMAYFSPALQRCDGKPIQATSVESFDGKLWQRWSRHRTGTNPWRPGIDNLATHMAAVQEWLARELRKGT